MFILFLVFLTGLWLWPAGPGAQMAKPPSPPLPEVRFPYFPVPPGLTLCGEAIPQQDPDVREALDREFTNTIWNRANTIMWLKRANRYFPEINRKIRAHKLPADLKYVVLIESDLRLKARSTAGALGPWQFMQPTAQRFQLRTGEAVDDRLDLGASTDAALRYLATLHRLFGNWPLALAAYNCGEGRVQKAMADQGVRDYYHLSLPEETERYIPRLVAAKTVLENPAAYGFDIPVEELYPSFEIDDAEIVLTQDAPVRRLAEAAGTYVKTLKTLNPWIKTGSLPAGSYRLKLPKGSSGKFLEAYRQGRLGGGPGT
jgi:hypothetical protein